MPKFAYVLTSNTGKHEEGELVAQNRGIAIRKLQTEGKIILSCTEITKSKREWFWDKPSLSFEDKMLFTKNLAAMIKAGITIPESFEIFIDQTSNKATKKMFENILIAIKNGQTLSKSLALYKNIFSDIYINMIAVGEEAGTLEQVLQYLDTQMEKDYDLRKKVKGALIYPAVILSVTMLMALGIVFFIMPKITKIFTTFNVVLPLPTRALIWLSNNILLTVGAIVATIVFLIFFFKIRAVKDGWQRVSLRLPVFGKILTKTYLARFSRNLHSLLQSGLAMTRSLEIVSSTIGNKPYEKAIVSARDRVEQGGTLGDAFSYSPKLFPIIMIKMLAVGEKTGGMESATEHLADLYEKDVDNITKNLSTLLEPLLLVFMAAVVGGLALSIIMPIYQLPNLIQK